MLQSMVLQRDGHDLMTEQQEHSGADHCVIHFLKTSMSPSIYPAGHVSLDNSA